MKYTTLLLVLSSVLLFARVNCDCGDVPKDSEEGDVKTWFKNLGCKIQKGAEDLQETAKPWAEKIGSSAKEFGHNVANKYGEIKHKLTDDDVLSSTQSSPVYNAPTEKVLLAPLSHDSPAPLPPSKNVPTVAPAAVNDRSLFQLNECPEGQTSDHRGNCRPKV